MVGNNNLTEMIGKLFKLWLKQSSLFWGILQLSEDLTRLVSNRLGKQFKQTKLTMGPSPKTQELQRIDVQLS